MKPLLAKGRLGMCNVCNHPCVCCTRNVLVYGMVPSACVECNENCDLITCWMGLDCLLCQHFIQSMVDTPVYLKSTLNSLLWIQQSGTSKREYTQLIMGAVCTWFHVWHHVAFLVSCSWLASNFVQVDLLWTHSPKCISVIVSVEEIIYSLRLIWHGLMLPFKTLFKSQLKSSKHGILCWDSAVHYFLWLWPILKVTARRSLKNNI